MREVVRNAALHLPTAIISGRSCDKVQNVGYPFQRIILYSKYLFMGFGLTPLNLLGVWVC